MARIPVFFISSTTHDLASYREAAAQALRDRELQVVVMTHFSPDYRQLREMLRQKMAPCEAVVCLIGFHYGGEPPGEAKPRRSYTQWEYFIAREMKKPVYLLFAKETTPWDKPPSEPEDMRQRQVEFREQLAGTEQRRDSFSSREELRDLVLRIPVPGRRTAALWAWPVVILGVAAILVWTKPWQPRGEPVRGGSSPPEKRAVPVREASKAEPFVNGLQMRFVPLPGELPAGRLLSVWETRCRDWEALGLRGGTPGKPDEPVRGVSTGEAIGFCLRLTQKERSEAAIPADWSYRLPTAEEWSAASNMRNGSTPTYPWGDEWEQTTATGNLRGEESGSTSGLPNDRHVDVAPVGSFPPNPNGFHDLAGNVWEICTSPEGPVLRGGSWRNAQQRVLRLDFPHPFSPESEYAKEAGFRCVLAPEK